MSPTMDAPALVVIDMHRGSIDPPGTAYVPAGRAVVPALASLMDRVHDLGVPVIHIVHQTLPDGSDARSPFWMESTSVGDLYPNVGEQVVGSPWTEIADGLPRYDDEHVVAKKRYGAFSGNGLDLLLRNLDVRTLILTGVMTEICVLATAFHAFNTDYRVVVARDGVAGRDPECAEAALRIVAREVGWVLDGDEIVELLAAGRTAT